MRSMFGHQTCRCRWDSVLVTVMGKLDELGSESHWWNDGVAIDDKSVLSDGGAETGELDKKSAILLDPGVCRMVKL